LTAKRIAATAHALVFASLSISAQGTNRFQPALLERPDVKLALQSVDDRATAIVDEWISIVGIPAPSTKEQKRAEYIRAEMQKIGLNDITVHDK
jgi:hypothetical protein